MGALPFSITRVCLEHPRAAVGVGAVGATVATSRLCLAATPSLIAAFAKSILSKDAIAFWADWVIHFNQIAILRIRRSIRLLLWDQE